jgi:hypothetical protein
MPRHFHIGAQNDTLYIISGEKPAAAGNDYPRHDADRTCVAQVFDEAEARRLVDLATAAIADGQATAQAPCGNREYCSRFPFCGCGGPDPLPERDATKPAEQQGLFRKFNVTRTDASSAKGGKHEGCEYFVLDTTHDQHAKAALSAYALACRATHPALAADLRDRCDLAVDLSALHGAEAQSDSEGGEPA